MSARRKGEGSLGTHSQIDPWDAHGSIAPSPRKKWLTFRAALTGFESFNAHFADSRRGLGFA
jgi:hypothetical protein